MPTMPIANIEIGDRHRRELGDLSELAESINSEGLLQPIGITEDRVLVFGERRLRAVQDILHWPDIECRIVNVSSIAAGRHRRDPGADGITQHQGEGRQDQDERKESESHGSSVRTGGGGKLCRRPQLANTQSSHEGGLGRDPGAPASTRRRPRSVHRHCKSPGVPLGFQGELRRRALSRLDPLR